VSKYGRYNIKLCALVLLVVSTICAINILVDPFGIWNLWNNKSVACKSEQETHERLCRAIAIINIKPSIIFIGSSRTRIGLDPGYYAQIYPETIYNTGVSSVTMDEMLWYFKHALQNQPKLKEIIVGIDFYGFNRNFPNGEDFPSQQMGKTHITYKSFLETAASLDALKSTLLTVKNNWGMPAPSFFEPNGKTSDPAIQNIYGKIVDIEGFTMINRFNINTKEHYANYELSPERIDEFRELVTICREKGIECKVFISPSHATDMEAIRVAGKWQEFENMKRQLCAITPILDLSGYNSITTDPIGSERRYYWDGSHYKKEIGNMILDQLIGIRGNSPADFGVMITPDNIEEHLIFIRQAREKWVKDNPDIVNYVQLLKKTQT